MGDRSPSTTSRRTSSAFWRKRTSGRSVLAPDVNVLVYAHRTDEPAYRPYRRWLEDLIGGPQPFALSVLVAVGFVRIVTNAKAYPSPTPLPMALAVIDEL